jgi:hypothetical protein
VLPLLIAAREQTEGEALKQRLKETIEALSAAP